MRISSSIFFLDARDLSGPLGFPELRALLATGRRRQAAGKTRSVALGW